MFPLDFWWPYVVPVKVFKTILHKNYPLQESVCMRQHAPFIGNCWIKGMMLWPPAPGNANPSDTTAKHPAFPSLIKELFLKKVFARKPILTVALEWRKMADICLPPRLRPQSTPQREWTNLHHDCGWPWLWRQSTVIFEIIGLCRQRFSIFPNLLKLYFFFLIDAGTILDSLLTFPDL